MRYKRLLDAENSISHLGDFVSATLDSYLQGLPYGIYHVTNPGAVTTRLVVDMIQEERARRIRENLEQPFPESFDFFESEEEFMKIAANTPRSNCVLDTRKILRSGIHLRPVEEAIREALQNWIPESSNSTLPSS